MVPFWLKANGTTFLLLHLKRGVGRPCVRDSFCIRLRCSCLFVQGARGEGQFLYSLAMQLPRALCTVGPRTGGTHLHWGVPVSDAPAQERWNASRHTLSRYTCPEGRWKASQCGIGAHMSCGTLESQSAEVGVLPVLWDAGKPVSVTFCGGQFL